MHSAGSYVLRDFFAATNWCPENHYSALSLTSRHLLDFPIPPGLNLSLANRPTSKFLSSLSLSALVPSHPITYPPTPAPILGPPLSYLLSGQLTYISSSVELGEIINTKRSSLLNKGRFKLKDLSQSFKVGNLPLKLNFREGAQPIWQAGERVDKQDYLLYGRLYAPSPRLDALYVHRFSSSLQALISLISVPSALSVSPIAWQSPSDDAAAKLAESAKISTASSAGTAARLSELEIKIQQDTGRWSTEYSYAVGDGMWGARGLWNFGRSGSGIQIEESDEGISEKFEEISRFEEEGGGGGVGVGGRRDSEKRERVVDEEEEMSTGLKGRWSAGGEVYFSAQERMAGVSTGVRFCTLPEPTSSSSSSASTSHGSNSVPTQPPTTITATLNPIMGQLSTAYSVAVSPDSALSSRFDFNLFSYDADLTFGGEWFSRQKEVIVVPEEGMNRMDRFDAFDRGVEDNLPLSPVIPGGKDELGEVTSVLKFRASTNTDLALLWEGRLGDFLVSFGVVADLRLATKKGGRNSPIRSVGIGIQYWS